MKGIVMYTAALVIAILFVVNAVTGVFDGKCPPGDEGIHGCACVVVLIPLAYTIVLLIGVLRYVNGYVPVLSGYGF